MTTPILSGINAGFDGGLQPDLPQFDQLHIVGVRRDVLVEREDWIQEFIGYPNVYLLALLRTKFDCTPEQLVEESLVLARMLTQARLVGRCGIEIGNEPNISPVAWANKAATFGPVVNRCAEAIWTVDPRIDVVSGGVSNTGQKEQAWLKALLAILRTDIIAGYHTYRDEDTPDTPHDFFASRAAEDASLRAIFGARRSMNTEFGRPVGPWSKKVAPSWVPESLKPYLKIQTVTGSWTEADQAKHVGREFELAAANGAERAFYYQLGGESGIRRPDGSLRPVAEVFAKFWEPDEDEPPTVAVSFKVLDEDGQPIAGVRVTAVSDFPEYPPVTSLSDAAGVVTFTGEHPRGVWVELQRDGYDQLRERRTFPSVSTGGPIEWWPAATVMRRPVVTLAVQDEHGLAVAGADVTIRHDSGDVASAMLRTDDRGLVSYLTNPQFPGWGAWVIITKDGFEFYKERRVLPMVSGPIPSAVLQHIVKQKAHSKAQLNFIQLDLMIRNEEVKPRFDERGWDAELQIKLIGDTGGIARGILEGWVWCTTIANYPTTKRQSNYAAAKRSGHTHFALHVAALGPGPGYHGIYPITQAMADGYGQAMNVVHRELRDVGLVPVCAGVAPGAPPAPGFDVHQVEVALTDWDNSAVAACRIRAVHEAFPNALVWYELPEGEIYPKPCDCGRGCESVAPTADNGGAWLRAMQQRYPRFVGLVCEVNAPDGIEANVAQLEKIYRWWRDVPINLGETDTYWKFWHNTDKQVAIAHNDELRRRCPWLHGTMSGWTCSPPPPDENTDTDVKPFPGDMINPSSVLVEDIPDLLRWPATAHITRVELRTGHVHIEFTKQTGPGRWPDIPFGQPGDSLQFSMGMCQLINGQWYAAAPIQWWYGLDEWGGPVQNQNVDGSGVGHIQKNWFYNAQWWPHLSGHQPKPGELIGLFVAAGNVRERIVPLHERSNIVTFTLPAPDQTAVFAWSTE